MVYLDRNTMLIGLIGTIALALVSFLIGYFSSSRTQIIEDYDYPFDFINDEGSNLADIVQQMSTDFMRDHLRFEKKTISNRLNAFKIKHSFFLVQL